MAFNERLPFARMLGFRTQEGQRGVGAPTLPPPTREAPPTPTEDQPLTEAVIDGIIRTRKIDEQPKKPNKIRVLISRGIMAGIVLTGVGLGINKIRSDDEPTPQTSSADFPNSFTDNRLVSRAESNTVKPEEVFDNKARSGEIGRTKRISEEETARLDSFAKINDGLNTVLAIHPIDVSTSDKPDAKIKYIKRGGGSGNDQDRINRTEQGYLNSFYFEKVPARSTIVALVDGTLTLFYSYPKKFIDTYPDHIDHEYNISTAAFNFQSGDGKKFRAIIGGGATKRGGMTPNFLNKDVFFLGFKSLTAAPIIKGEMSPSEVLEITKQRSIPVKKGQPILQLPDKEFNIGFEIISQDFDPSKGKEEIINGEKRLIVQEYPTNVQLFLSDGVVVQPQLPSN